MITLSNVSKTYQAGKENAFTALNPIDLTIDAKRMTVIKGPSGSGKTTLLSLIGCISRPTTGRIHILGREISGLPERFGAKLRRETFGFIFQNYHLVRGLSVLENTMIPAYPTGKRHKLVQKKALELLERFEIVSKARQLVEHLSGGEQQRTVIARALINDPQIIIADEPTAHLDTDLAQTLMNILASLKRGGKTLLVASHDPLVFDSPLVDQTVCMRDGRIVGGDMIAA
jgi:putative ABC transport system ATP-binding protein